MKIAQLAPLSESVPPKGYGGTELVVSQLTEELIRQGHEVVLFAAGDSRTEAELVSVTPRGLRMDEVPPHRWCAYETRLILKLLERQNDFDVIHSHLGYMALPHLDRLNVPVVSTNHNPVKQYCEDIYLRYRHLPFVYISDAYKRLNHPDALNYVGRVYNAVDLETYCPGAISPDRIGDQKRDYVLFMGRVSHAKGTADAIKVARAIGMPLKIAGKIDVTDRKYYEERVKDELRDGVEYVGEVDFQQKVDLCRGARAIIYPIHFEEPFGLVMVEGLASGTPLVALERGSVGEILDDKKDAIVGKSVEELIERFHEVDDIRSSDCIAKAEMFGISRMTAGYIEIYERLIEQGKSGTRMMQHAAG